jgi:hypothetical protein
MSSVQPRDEASGKLRQIQRRRSFRIQQGLGVSCEIVEMDESLGDVAQVTELTQRNVNLLTRRSYEPGSYLHLTLSNADELFRTSAIVVVRTTKATSDGIHFTGCEFLQALAYNHLCILLA